MSLPVHGEGCKAFVVDQQSVVIRVRHVQSMETATATFVLRWGNRAVRKAEAIILVSFPLNVVYVKWFVP